MLRAVSVLVSGLMFSLPVWAEEALYFSETGERFSISQTKDGKYWATLIISDKHTASFANNELILLQLDDQAPISLEHGNLSCGSPAKAEQTVFYEFSTSANGVFAKSESQPLPKGFDQVRQRDVFRSITADRRAETVDFELSDKTVTVQQLESANTLNFRFVTDDEIRRQATFKLQ
ncbi:hypothetical protein [Methylophaga sp.]|uniref:hypothetical protein n=1 Tax=Methylophaga sp. TaxID=2024840 RepID=UPI00271E6713|nr:hypothetical protein [Methylophaga sp.]MDO8827237.1 hypothetical protein [Methylophaga sp.]